MRRNRFAMMDELELAEFFRDAQQALTFIEPQLLRIEAGVYMQQYQSFDYASLMPVDTDGDMWEAGTLYFSGDIAGKAEWFNAKSQDFPFADVSRDMYERANHMAAIGYEWSTSELIRAARAGRDLSGEKAAAARRVAEQFTYNVAMFGSAEKNFVGAINNAAVPTTAAGAAWTGASTAASIIADINAVLMAPYNATKGIYNADILILPPSAVQFLAAAFVPNTQTTLLQFIRTNNAISSTTGQAIEIRSRFEMETAGAGGTRRMAAWARDRNVIQFHLPGPHTFFPVYQNGAFSYEVPGLMNIGGTEFRIPAGAAYRDAF